MEKTLVNVIKKIDFENDVLRKENYLYIAETLDLNFPEAIGLSPMEVLAPCNVNRLAHGLKEITKNMMSEFYGEFYVITFLDSLVNAQVAADARRSKLSLGNSNARDLKAKEAIINLDNESKSNRPRTILITSCMDIEKMKNYENKINKDEE